MLITSVVFFFTAARLQCSFKPHQGCFKTRQCSTKHVLITPAALVSPLIDCGPIGWLILTPTSHHVILIFALLCLAPLLGYVVGSFGSRRSDAAEIQISDKDYFTRATEFKVWLCHKKKKFFEDLTSVESHELFEKFVKDWNR